MTSRKLSKSSFKLNIGYGTRFREKKWRVENVLNRLSNILFLFSLVENIKKVSIII